MYFKCWKRRLMIAFFFPTYEGEKAEFIYRTVCLWSKCSWGKDYNKETNFFYFFLHFNFTASFFSFASVLWFHVNVLYPSLISTPTCWRVLSATVRISGDQSLKASYIYEQWLPRFPVSGKDVSQREVLNTGQKLLSVFDS